MKTKLLLPHCCKFIGLGILLVGIASIFFTKQLETVLTFDMHNSAYFALLDHGCNQDFTYTIQIFLIVVGGMMLMFSREKVEDEFTMQIRLKSLMYSVLVNYLIVLITNAFLYGMSFMYVMIYNFYTIIILYVIIFHILILKNSKKNEKYN
jgi:hypothetical protein